MDINWLGHACIRLRTQRASIIMDPVDRGSGVDMGRPTADIVTVSHAHPSHSNVRGVRGQPLVLDAPGEYEIHGVLLMGVTTSLQPPAEGEPAERNTVFVVESEELRVAHLGGLGSPLTEAETEQLAGIDVLVVPVGGERVLDVEAAARIVRALDPAVVIPVHYAPAETNGALQRFIKAVGVEPRSPERRATFQRRGLRGETVRLVLLEPRGA